MKPTNAVMLADLRQRAEKCQGTFTAVQLTLAADLLEAHIDTGLELESWDTAAKFVERYTGWPIDIDDRWPGGESWSVLHSGRGQFITSGVRRVGGRP